MAKNEWIERSIEDLIRDDRELATDVQSALSSASEAAKFIRDMRSIAGLSQLELARRLGISQPRVSAMEKGSGPDGPTYGMLRRIARACGLEWSLERGLRRRQSAQHEEGTGALTSMAAGAFGFLAGALGMALLRTTGRPNEAGDTSSVSEHEMFEEVLVGSVRDTASALEGSGTRPVPPGRGRSTRG
jgi:transcriptional regulator with XRE-family HTH domain